MIIIPFHANIFDSKKHTKYFTKKWHVDKNELYVKIWLKYIIPTEERKINGASFRSFPLVHIQSIILVLASKRVQRKYLCEYVVLTLCSIPICFFMLFSHKIAKKISEKIAKTNNLDKMVKYEKICIIMM